MCRYSKLLSGYVLDNKDKEMGKHVCLIVEGGKVLSYGYSNNVRTYFCGMPVSSLHSEMHAVSPLMDTEEKVFLKNSCQLHTETFISNTREEKYFPIKHRSTLQSSRRIRKWSRRYAIICKVHWNEDGSITFMYSKPCLQCANILYYLGIRKVVYSTENGFDKIYLEQEMYRPSSGIQLLK